MQKLLPDQKVWGPCTPSTSPRSWSRILDLDPPSQTSDQTTIGRDANDLSSSPPLSENRQSHSGEQLQAEALEATKKNSDVESPRPTEVRDPYEGLGAFFDQREAIARGQDDTQVRLPAKKEDEARSQLSGRSKGKMAAGVGSTYSPKIMPTGQGNTAPEITSKVPIRGPDRQTKPIVRLPPFISRKQPPVYPILVSDGITAHQRSKLEALGLLADTPKISKTNPHSFLTPKSFAQEYWGTRPTLAPSSDPTPHLRKYRTGRS